MNDGAREAEVRTLRYRENAQPRKTRDHANDHPPINITSHRWTATPCANPNVKICQNQRSIFA